MIKKLFIPIFLLTLFIFSMADTLHASDSLNNYTRLMELIRVEEQERPLFIFSDYKENFDQDLHKASKEFINQEPELINKIKRDLDDRSIQWHLEKISHRLLYVPETREEYATLFENYCNEVITDILRLTGLNGPDINIHTLGMNQPDPSEANGVHAFIVHDLAKEYIATYVFSNDDQKKVRIKLTGKVFLNEVGSFSSYIYLKEDGSVEFTREHHTIWQNNSKNPYTVLMTPVEETLHIALRPYTEEAIKKRIELKDIKNIKEVERIVEEWISVEEAVVGGLVYALQPFIIEKYIHNLAESLIESDLETKNQYLKYRHLRKGIEVVEQLGYKESVKLYQADPTAFRDLLS